MSRRPLVLALLLAAVVGLVGAQPAGAADTVLRGSLYGEDGQAVSALLGFDLRDEQGRVLGASGCVRSPSCPVEGYAITKRVNFNLDEDGGDPDRWPTEWSVALPAEAERVYIEAYPQGHRYEGTDTSRYAASFRRNLRVPYDTKVNLRLPLVCGKRGENGVRGTAGSVRGEAQEQETGRPVRLKRVTAFSLERDDNRPSPVLGFGVGTVREDGSYEVRNLASGAGPAVQRYQLIATAADGRVRRVFQGAAVGDCGRVVRDILF